MSQETVKSLSAEQLVVELRRLADGKRAQLVLRRADSDVLITVTYEQETAKFVMIQPGGAKTCTTNAVWCRDFLRKNRFFYIVETTEKEEPQFWRITNIYDASSPRRLREVFLDVIMPDESTNINTIKHKVQTRLDSGTQRSVCVAFVRERQVCYAFVYKAGPERLNMRLWNSVLNNWSTNDQHFVPPPNQSMCILPFDPTRLLRSFAVYRNLLLETLTKQHDFVYESQTWRFRQNDNGLEYTLLAGKEPCQAFRPVTTEMVLSEQGFLSLLRGPEPAVAAEQPGVKPPPVVKQNTDKLREQIQTAQRDLSVSLHELFNDLTEASDELDEVLYRKQFSGGWLRFLNLGKQSARTWLIQYRAREQDKWVMLVACDDNPWQLVDTVREQEMLGIGEKFLPPA